MWDLNNGIIWCHYIIIVKREKGYSANLDVNLIKVQSLCDQTLKRNASYGQEDFPFKHFKLFEYGWLGTYIAMIFWVAKIFINQSPCFCEVYFYKIYLEKHYFFIKHSALLQNIEVENFFSNLATPNIIGL